MNTYQFYPCYPDGKRKAFTVSYDDGNTCDEQLVALLRKYHAKGTFHLNSGCFYDPKNPASDGKKWRRMTADECVQLYGDDMEVAVHGARHLHWDRISRACAMQDILDDKRNLERLFGRVIRGASYPYGAFNDDVVDILRLAEFAYCRTVNTTKTTKVGDFDPLRFQGTVRGNDPMVSELARAFVNEPARNGQLHLFYVWGHSYEFVQEDTWGLAESILATVCDREDVWYCTNIELFDYFAAAKQLHWSIDRTLVYNPTATDIWLHGSLKHNDPAPLCFKIPAGSTISMPVGE